VSGVEVNLGYGVLSIERGLGIRKLITFNQVLVGKWLCQFGVFDKHHPWKCIISMKYRETYRGWTIEVVRGSLGVGLWKSIRKGRDQSCQYRTGGHFGLAKEMKYFGTG
jgi:hypothetical protein